MRTVARVFPLGDLQSNGTRFLAHSAQFSWPRSTGELGITSEPQSLCRRVFAGGSVAAFLGVLAVWIFLRSTARRRNVLCGYRIRTLSDAADRRARARARVGRCVWAGGVRAIGPQCWTTTWECPGHNRADAKGERERVLRAHTARLFPKTFARPPQSAWRYSTYRVSGYSSDTAVEYKYSRYSRI
eukprot:3904975-Prymnesium_polylepis.2